MRSQESREQTEEQHRVSGKRNEKKPTGSSVIVTLQKPQHKQNVRRAARGKKAPFPEERQAGPRSTATGRGEGSTVASSSPARRLRGKSAQAACVLRELTARPAAPSTGSKVQGFLAPSAFVPSAGPKANPVGIRRCAMGAGDKNATKSLLF